MTNIHGQCHIQCIATRNQSQNSISENLQNTNNNANQRIVALTVKDPESSMAMCPHIIGWETVGILIAVISWKYFSSFCSEANVAI